MARLAYLSVALFALASFSGCAGCAAPAAECATEIECAGNPSGKTRCDVLTSLCVECLDDSHCPNGPCLPDGTCGRCTTDLDCEAGEVCTPEQTCEPSCSSGKPCPTGLKCLAALEKCVMCLGDADCGPGRVCSPNHECEPGCSQAQPQCPTGQVCSFVEGRCVACTQDTHCPGSTPKCVPSTNTCVECITHADCSDPSKPVCDGTTNTCVGCLNDAQCAPGSVCENKTCVPGCTATQPCPQGQQCKLPQGTCVGCVDDSGCGGATPVCNVTTNTCVECLPGAQDSCPSGSYCRADSVCEQGCKTGADCPSGVCLPDHSCQSCTSDSQCAAGKVCENGSCIPSCSETAPCGSGRTCCGGHCVEDKVDEQNCGACGVVCGSNETCCGGSCTKLNTPVHCGACGITCAPGQGCCNGVCTALNTLQNCGGCGVACKPGDFCDGTQCNTPTYPNFCQNPNVWVIYDGVAIDDASANVMASTITTWCPPSVTVNYGQQTNPQLVNQMTGQPLTGSGTTLILAGGPWPNKPVKWLELTKKATSVYFKSDGVNYFFKKRSDDSTVSQMAGNTCSPHTDQFLVHLVTDPASGTLALIGYGACPSGYGTQAAGFYYANVMLPNRQNYPNSWYVVSWTDANNDSVPNGVDTFTILASGN